MTIQYGLEEQFILKSEVLNLEFELKSFVDKSLRPVLVVKDTGHVLARLLLSGPEFTALRGAFQKQSQPDWNFFDIVTTRVNDSLKESSLRRIETVPTCLDCFCSIDSCICGTSEAAIS